MTTEKDRAPLSEEVKRLDGEVGTHAHHPLRRFPLFEQLKQRNVFRVAVLYLVVCWLILDPLHVVFHMLEVPGWANRLVVVLMAIGFPAVLVFAWVYEITPEGLKLTVEVPHGQSIRGLTRRRLDVAITAMLVVALAYFVVDKFWLSKHAESSTASKTVSARPQPTLPEKSIAVLPFADMSEKHDQEYFADGMAEETLNLLSQIPQLAVIARTSSFQFRVRNEDLRAVGKMLGARYVVEGSVRREADRLRVTAQLIDTQTGAHRWSRTFERQVQNVFAVQAQIAAEIALALELSTDAQQSRLDAQPPNQDAYNLFLRGMNAMFRFDEEGFERANLYFEQALSADPHFARAAGWLGVSEDFQAEWGYVDARTGFEKARKSAEFALGLDPKLKVNHIVLAMIHQAYDWDWQAAEAEIALASIGQPPGADLLWVKGRQALITGRLEEAQRLLRQSVAMDPFNPGVILNLGWVQHRAGKLDDAERTVRRVLQISPTYVSAHYYLGLVLLSQGRLEEALNEMQLEADPEYGLIGRSIVLHSLGKGSEADSVLEKLRERFAKTWPSGIARVYAWRKDPEQAAQWLDRAYAQKDVDLYLIKVDTLLAVIQNDVRYKAFLRKMRLPESTTSD